MTPIGCGSEKFQVGKVIILKPNFTILLLEFITSWSFFAVFKMVWVPFPLLKVLSKIVFQILRVWKMQRLFRGQQI